MRSRAAVRQKLEVVDEQSGVLGWIYVDLFSRGGKPGGAAHYTVRCSRRTDDDDEHRDLAGIEHEHVREMVQPSIQFDALNRTRVPGVEGTFQLPVVVLLCDFKRPNRGASILAWHEVLTLFHEMGHAMHCE